MRQATTPEHTFKLPVDTDTCDIIQVTYEQGKTQLVKEKNRGEIPDEMTLDGQKVIILLTQEETLLFSAKHPVEVQIRVLTNTGRVLASQIWEVDVSKSLNKEALT